LALPVINEVGEGDPDLSMQTRIYTSQ